MNDLSRLRDLAVIGDHDAGLLLSDSTRADLAQQITSTPPQPARRAGQRPGRATSARRRWLIALPAAAALGAGLLIASVLGSPGGKIVPGPAQAQALVFTRHGHYIDVIVKNPVADPKRYRAEFKAHGLNITLQMISASPSLVGTVLYFGGTDATPIKVITAKGRCFTGGGGFSCPVGLRVPVNFRGEADLAFGRAARPGEHYESTTSATAPGEALHGLRISGLRISAVLPMLSRRHVTVAYYHVQNTHGARLVRPGKIPHTWFVYSADPWAPGQVALWVGPTRRPGPVGQPAPGTPVPTPTGSRPAA